MKITLLLDNPQSWFVPYAEELEQILTARGHTICRIQDAEDIKEGDCAFFLSCERIIPPELLSRHAHNIVIHGSALPQGKGMSPLTWQILEWKNEITLTLFEAAEHVDAGNIYAQAVVSFEGHELIDELRQKEAETIIKLATEFIETYPPGIGRIQEGEETFYPRRRPRDSEIDISKSIIEVFNLLRIVDNERYPAFFTHLGHRYELRIHKKKTI